jgi:hypothetical protein
MAGRTEIKCIGPSYSLGDRKAAVQRSINLYMQQVEGLGEDKQVILVSAPGLEVFASLGATARGAFNCDGRLFVVAGSSLYEVSSAGALTLRGALVGTYGPVSMAYGRDQLVIVDGANGYVLNLMTNAYGQITDPDWRGSNTVEEIDGYFVFAAPGTDQFYISAIDDAASLDALDFSSADAKPDNIVSFRVHKRELILFGTRSAEVWIDSGGADFPFTRYNSTPIDIGLVGTRAHAICADALCYVGNTDRGRGYVYEMRGHQPTRISTQAVEEALAASTDISQCSMWSYHVSGNEFLGLNAPGMATSWVYDFSIRQWHERGEYIEGEWNPSRVEFVISYEGLQLGIGGAYIYRMGSDVHSLAGDALVRERTWPHLMAPSFEPVSYRGLDLACTTGGAAAGNITLEVSNDGGYVFGPPLMRSLGAVGRYMQRVRWLLLGTSRDRVFRLRCSDAVALNIHAAAVDA